MTEHDDIAPVGGLRTTPPLTIGSSAGAATNAGAPTPAAATPAPYTGDEPPPSADEVRTALRRVKDPELNLNIVDLGLVYDIAVDGRAVKVDMSLTSPGCPSGPEIMKDAEQQAKNVPGVAEVAINLVWSPIWTPDRIEPRVRSYLGF